jgi:glycosyltransferase involved in cell wall biosynthesis
LPNGCDLSPPGVPLKPKVAIITEIIAPYRIPVFNALAERPEIDLHIVFLSETDPTLRQWQVYKDEIQFRYEILRSWRWRVGGHNLLLNRGLHSTLRRLNPDVVIAGGYNYAACWSAAYWAKAASIPFLLWTESTIHDQRKKYPLVEFAKKRFLNLCSGFIVPGKSSLQYLEQLGVPENQMTTAPNAVDTSLFSNLADAARGNPAVLRARHNLPSQYFLFVGRFVREKGVFDVIEAYSQLPPEIRNEIGLVFVGDGPARTALHDQSRILQGNVQFPGFLHREELAQVYGLAEAFIFPTLSDPWGLVVNEAMACGLPVIASSVAGCTADLVEDSVNGVLVEPHDIPHLTLAMENLAKNPEMRLGMGRKSRERIDFYSPDAWAAGMIKAVHSVSAEEAKLVA